MVSGNYSDLWTVDAPSDWTEPAGLTLLGCERTETGWAPLAVLDLLAVRQRLGVDDASLDGLSWSWVVPGGAADLSSVNLISTVMRACLPLVDVPRFLGRQVTHECLRELGYLLDASGPVAEPEGQSSMVKALEAVVLMDI